MGEGRKYDICLVVIDNYGNSRRKFYHEAFDLAEMFAALERTIENREVKIQQGSFTVRRWTRSGSKNRWQVRITQHDLTY